MLYHLWPCFGSYSWFLLVSCMCLSSLFRVAGESAVAEPESEPGVEPAHECETEQQQGKHPLDHTCSYLNSQAYNYMHAMMILWVQMSFYVG